MPLLPPPCFLGGGTAAYAHVQVQPDGRRAAGPVKFSVIVPGESEAQTVKVELQLPPNLLPFAWEETSRLDAARSCPATTDSRSGT